MVLVVVWVELQHVPAAHSVQLRLSTECVVPAAINEPPAKCASQWRRMSCLSQQSTADWSPLHHGVLLLLLLLLILRLVSGDNVEKQGFTGGI